MEAIVSDIRRAIAADVEAVIGCDPVAARQPARREFICRSIDAGACFVAISGGRMVGYGVLEYTFYGNGFLSMLCVAKAFERRGIGSALVRHIERECRTPKLFTSTNASNASMRALLAKLGFEPSGVIENLDDGDPELVFVKRLRS
jgi:ribosomal protein S18 acetylase RimI-like enzyme